jgi:hypothetical protein
MNKEFLEEYSLFRKFTFTVPKYLNEILKPPINMECEDCKNTQTFNMINQYWESNRFYDKNALEKGFVKAQSNGEKVILLYECQSCKKFTRQFNVFISPDLDYVYKFGQYPEWEIKMDKNLVSMLGKHSKTFRKGLVCESQGYGIGAFAYYRRITEEIIDELLESITDLIETEHKTKYREALEKTKQTRVTQEKIDLVKDLLPSILKPEGMNPLGVLHSKLSEGLHEETDQSCLENATYIKDILTFLINQIIQSRESAKGFTERMKLLLEKKSKK